MMLCVWSAALYLRPRLEAKLRSDVHASLHARGLKPAKVRAEWRKVILEIYGGNPAVSRQFYETASRVAGVSSVIVESLPLREPTLELEFVSRGRASAIEARGLVGSQSLKDEILRLSDSFQQKTVSVSDSPDVRVGALDDMLCQLLGSWSRHAHSIRTAKLTVREGKVEMETTYGQRDGLLQAAAILRNHPLVANSVQRKFILKPFPNEPARTTASRILDNALLPDTIPNIGFGFASTNLSEENQALLEKLSQLLRTNPKLKVRITGFTDNSGVPEYNLHLSRQRALQVADQLRQAGVSQTSLEIDAKGASDFLADNETLAGRQLNRRVEFQILRQG